MPLSNPPSIPFFIQWHLTARCTGDCAFCYVLDSPTYQKELKEELSREECFGFIEKLSAFLNKNSLRGEVMITGGDPLIREDIWEILEKLRKNGLSFSILGNPYLLNEYNVGRLKDLGISHYQLSIDGLEETHDRFRGKGSYQKTWEKVRLLQKGGVSVGISFTLSQANLKETVAVLELSAREKANSFRLSRLTPIGRGSDFSKEILTAEQCQSVLKKVCGKFLQLNREKLIIGGMPSCDGIELVALKEILPSFPLPTQLGCHGNLLAILPDGGVYPCRRLPILLGNILKDSMEELLDHPVVKKLRDPASFQECKGCSRFGFCGGGCPAISYAITGDPCAKDPQCWVNSKKSEKTLDAEELDEENPEDKLDIKDILLDTEDLLEEGEYQEKLETFNGGEIYLLFDASPEIKEEWQKRLICSICFASNFFRGEGVELPKAPYRVVLSSTFTETKSLLFEKSGGTFHLQPNAASAVWDGALYAQQKASGKMDTHEYIHLVMMDSQKKAGLREFSLPMWYNEGIAQYVQGKKEGTDFLGLARKLDRVPPFTLQAMNIPTEKLWMEFGIMDQHILTGNHPGLTACASLVQFLAEKEGLGFEKVWKLTLEPDFRSFYQKIVEYTGLNLFQLLNNYLYYIDKPVLLPDQKIWEMPVVVGRDFRGEFVMEKKSFETLSFPSPLSRG